MITLSLPPPYLYLHILTYISPYPIPYISPTFPILPPLVYPTHTSSPQVKTEDNYIQSMSFATCVNAAGPWARDVARMAGIGTGEDVLSQDLPVEPRLFPTTVT